MTCDDEPSEEIKRKKRAYTQWWLAWCLLADDVQERIVAFCLRSDGDVAEVALWL